MQVIKMMFFLLAADADGSRISFMGGAPPVPQHCNRDQTLIDLSAWLQDSSGNRLLTFIHGLPGIGKSLVAKLFYHRAKQLHWKVVYVGERHLQRSGSKEIADEIRLNASAGDALIILDGFDHLIDLSPTACKALLYDCLRHAKKVLVTSRSHFSVVDLNPNVINLPPLEQSETEEYIIKMFSTIEGAEATSLASYSYGHPMLLNHFIELIKRNVFTPRELAAEVVAAGFRDLWTFLNRTLTTATANEDRLWYVFEHCFSAFGDDRTAKMACIAVFPLTFTAKAAEAITGDDSIAMFMADRSLLTRVSGGRMEMAHSLKSFLRHVAKTKYLQAYSNAKVRYYSYYIGLILKLSNMLSKCARHVLSEFEADKHNFEFVLGCDTIPLELHGDFMDVVLRANLLLKFCWSQDDLVKLYERCVDLATNREQMTVKARLEILLADQYVCRGRADEAVYLLEQAKKVFKSGNKDAYVLALASCYATLGSAHRCRGRIEEALMNLFKAKELHDNNSSLRRDSECRECRVSVLHALGVTFAHLNLDSKAWTWFKRAQVECQMLGQPIEAKPEGSQRRPCILGLRRGVHPHIADIYLNMAEVASASGNYKQALDYLQEIGTIQEKLGFDAVIPAQVTYSEGVIGYLAGGAGRDAGIRCMEKAFSISRGLLRFFIALVLGKIKYGQKEFTAAFGYFCAAKSAADEIAYKGYGYKETLAYGCVSAKVAGNTMATSLYEELRCCFSHQSKSEISRILAPVLRVMNGSTTLPKAVICCWFYNRFCCHHRCLAKASSTSGLSKFPFSDLGRAKFRFSVALDQTQIRQEVQSEPLSPTFAYGLSEINEDEAETCDTERSSQKTSSLRSQRNRPSEIRPKSDFVKPDQERSEDQVHQMGDESFLPSPVFNAEKFIFKTGGRERSETH